MQTIYLDNAATTPTDPRIIEAMLPYFSEIYGNPESPHHKGKEALIAIDKARETVAQILNCRQSEIYFFGSATEANNAIILGLNPRHLLTSQIEHASILEPAKQLNTSFLAVDKEGFVSPEELEKNIRPETELISIIYANNEIGTIQDIEKLAEISRKHNIPLHTDACQAAGSLPLDTQKLGVSALTLNGSKIYGPKGIGVLYLKQGIKLKALTFGGQQEKGLRPGTHNVPAIVGFAKALELSQYEPYKIAPLRDQLIEALLSEIPGAFLSGPTGSRRLPNNINICIPKIEASELILHLDHEGICISSGSACSTGQAKPSQVLKAIGLNDEQIHSSIRISLSRHSSPADLQKTAETILKIARATT